MQNKFAKFDDFEIFFNMSQDMLCIAGTDDFFKKVNPAFRRTLGHSDEELLTKPFIEFVHPDDTLATLDKIKELRSGSLTGYFENRYRHKNGSYRIFSWSASLDRESGGLYCVARDLTAIRHTESQLHQINKALHNEAIVAVTDSAGTITEVNEKFCQISGYSEAELIGQNHRIINSGVHPKHFFQQMWKTISAGKSWSGMIENRCKDGTHYFVYTIITPIFDAQGKISNYFWIRFDTTKHIELKSIFKKHLAILNEMGSIAKVGGWELDIKTGNLTWTDETFRIFELEPKLGYSPILPEGLELYTEQSKPIIEKAINRAIEFGESYSLELQAKTAKGNVLWVYTNGKANYIDGKIITLSGTIQDIDLRKINEQKYELERMKSIQNAKLASLGELSAGIAHEINNPLSIISGIAQSFPKFLSNPEKLNAYAGEIEKSCDRISRIVSSLKKFSRSSDENNKTLHCLRDIAHEAIILTEAKSKRHATAVSFACRSDALIMCDVGEIEQVIINLINNAIDAVCELPEKWVELILFEQGNHLVFKVRDSGPGISPDIQDQLFDPFFTTKNAEKGTGLGLSITKGILDEHKATISIEQGESNTCFMIEFEKYRTEKNEN